jgi:hypothetical protein
MVQKPSIVVIGAASMDGLYCIEDIIENVRDFSIIALSRQGRPHNTPSYIKHYVNISAENMFLILKKATYVLWMCCPKKCGHMEFLEDKRMSGSFPISFTTGCILITHNDIQKNNSHLGSILYYDDGKKITLDPYPNLNQVFNDRDKLIKIRDRVLSKITNSN